MTWVVALLGAESLADALHERLTSAGLTTLFVGDPTAQELPAAARAAAVATQAARQVAGSRPEPDVALMRTALDVDVMDTLQAVFGTRVLLVVQVDGDAQHHQFFDRATFTLGTGPAHAHDLDRLVEVLKPRPYLRPNRYEQGMYLARAASLRSAGLRGGVGCAILDAQGDVVALGANEVPRAGGGQYWCDSPDDARDFHRGQDPAYVSKHATVLALLSRLSAIGVYHGDDETVAADCIGFLEGDATRPGLPSTATAVQGFESLGRVVHAELAALAAAARHGTSVVGCEAVVTRPPCRQCLRQLIVSGIRSVRFLGPTTPGAYAFHEDAITTDPGETERVLVMPMVGVTPLGYGAAFTVGETGRPVGDQPALLSAQVTLNLLGRAAPLEEAARQATAAPYARQLVAFLHALRRDLASGLVGTGDTATAPRTAGVTAGGRR